MDELGSLLQRDYRLQGRRSGVTMMYRWRYVVSAWPVRFPYGNSFRATSSYYDSRRADGAAPATIAYELRLLARSFVLAVDSGLLESSPRIALPRFQNARQGFFSRDEVDRLIGALPPVLGDVTFFAYLTGWRRGECLGLRWEQVDRAAMTLRLEPGTTKNGCGRVFPYGEYPELRWLVSKRLGLACGPWVFHRGGHVVCRDFWITWRRACERAGVQGRVFHDLRRSAVRNLERAGVPRRVAMALTGHKTEAVYARYDIVNEADLGAGVARLAAVSVQGKAL